MIITVPLKPDTGGYTTQQCKKDGCEKKFKVKFGNGSNDSIAYCPYCGYQGQFWTVEQMQYLDCMALYKGNAPPGLCPMPQETNGPGNSHQYNCKNKHKEKIKHEGPTMNFYCILCGEQEGRKKKKSTRPKRQKARR